LYAVGCSDSLANALLVRKSAHSLVLRSLYLLCKKAKLRKELFGAIMSQEMGFFHSTRTGELINRLSADCTLIQVTQTTNIWLLSL
jgi:ABC-type multidrug transport system fused ATPase/permease subunit